MKVMTKQDHFQAFSDFLYFNFVTPSNCFLRVKQHLVTLKGPDAYELGFCRAKQLQGCTHASQFV